jgi:sec-independent protein translocase protein TatB
VQFLGVGWQEVLVIGVLAFFVLGPERLPVVAYQLGKAVRTLQGYARAVRDEFGEELTYVEEQYKTVRGDFDDARKEIRAQQRVIEDEWRTQQREIESVTNEAKTAVESAGKVVNISDRSPVTAPAPAALPAPAPVTAAEAAIPAAAPAVETPKPPSGGPPLVF